MILEVFSNLNNSMILPLTATAVSVPALERWGFRFQDSTPLNSTKRTEVSELAVEVHFSHAPRSKMRATVDSTFHKRHESLFVPKTFLVNSTSL